MADIFRRLAYSFLDMGQKIVTCGCSCKKQWGPALILAGKKVRHPIMDALLINMAELPEQASPPKKKHLATEKEVGEIIKELLVVEK